jgi:hypothetical protein
MPDSRRLQPWEAVGWPVNWSAIWVGALATLAVGLVLGLIGTAIGAYQETHIVSWHKFHIWTLVLSVCGAFYSFAVGGWVTARSWEPSPKSCCTSDRQSSRSQSCWCWRRWAPPATSVCGTEASPARRCGVSGVV